MLWALVLGYLVFGEVLTVFVFVGAAIIAGAGLYVIWRERRLRMRRLRGGELGGTCVVAGSTVGEADDTMSSKRLSRQVPRFYFRFRGTADMAGPAAGPRSGRK